MSAAAARPVAAAARWAAADSGCQSYLSPSPVDAPAGPRRTGRDAGFTAALRFQSDRQFGQMRSVRELQCSQQLAVDDGERPVRFTCGVELSVSRIVSIVVR